MFGILGLGDKETIYYTEKADFYEDVSKKQKLYKKVKWTPPPFLEWEYPKMRIRKNHRSFNLAMVFLFLILYFWK